MASNTTVPTRYEWVTTGAVETPCTATTSDRFGPCGDAVATVTYAYVCQAYAITSAGKEVLNYNVDVASLSAIILSSSLFGCTPQNVLTLTRTQPCAARACEVTRLQRIASACESVRGLTCGATSRAVTAKCFSVTLNTFIEDMTLWSGPCVVASAPQPEALVLQRCDGAQTALGMPAVASALPQCVDGAFEFAYEPWSRCLSSGATALSNATPLDCATCTSFDGNGTCLLSGVRLRTATCVQTWTNGTTSVAPLASCGSAITQEACTQDCYRADLYTVDSWSACQSSCTCGISCGTANVQSFTQTRSVLPCSTPSVPCTAHRTPPASSRLCYHEPCNPCAALNSTVHGSVCNAAGTRTDNATGLLTCVPRYGGPQCTCLSGWSGARCHLQAGQGLVDASGQLCPGVLLSSDGSCCTSGWVSRQGTCCSAAGVDRCGACAGTTPIAPAGLDRYGECCVGTLTADLTCCPSDQTLDACGVCGGDSGSCTKAVNGSITLATGRSEPDFDTIYYEFLTGATITKTAALSGRRRLLAATAVAYSVSEASVVAYKPTHLAGRFVLAGGNATDVGVLAGVPAPPGVSVSPVSGNGYCETGESVDMSGGDCLAMQLCPTPAYIGDPAQPCGGNGACHLATGACFCYEGYEGLDCGTCNATAQFVEHSVSSSGLTQCSPVLADVLQRVAPLAVPPDAPPPPISITPGNDSSGGTVSPVAGLSSTAWFIVAGIAAVVLIAAATAACMVLRRGRAPVAPGAVPTDGAQRTLMPGDGMDARANRVDSLQWRLQQVVPFDDTQLTSGNLMGEEIPHERRPPTRTLWQ